MTRLQLTIGLGLALGLASCVSSPPPPPPPMTPEQPIKASPSTPVERDPVPNVTSTDNDKRGN